MICPNCAAQGLVGEFCSHCGARLPLDDPSTGRAEEALRGESTHEAVQGSHDSSSDPGFFPEEGLDPHFRQGEEETLGMTSSQVEPPLQEAGEGDQVDLFTDPGYTGEPALGENLFQEQGEDELAATDGLFSEMEAAGGGKDHEMVDRTKEAASNFGGFFLNYLKKPSEGLKAKEEDLLPGLISLSGFTIFSALNILLVFRKIAETVNKGVFLDGFLLPILSVLLLILLAMATSYAGILFSHKEASINGLVAKFGALAIPFLALQVVNTIIALAGLTSLYLILSITAFSGIMLIIPAYMILERASKQYDQLYILLGLGLVNILVFGLVMSAFKDILLINGLGRFVGGMMGIF